MLSQYLMIGEITKPQGVRGEVKVRPCTCDPERFEGLETVYIEKDGGYAPLKITVNRLGTDAVFMNVEGVTDRGTMTATSSLTCTACGAWWTTGATWAS